MKPFLVLCCILFLVNFFAFSSGLPLAPKMIEENSLSFKVLPGSTDLQVRFYAVMLDKNAKLLFETGNGNHFNFSEQALPFDVHDYWQKKGSEDYYVLLTKVAYTVPASSHYFTEKLLADPVYISRTLPENYKLKKVGSRRFHLDCGFLGPDFSYDLNFYTGQKGTGRTAAMLQHIARLNPELPAPMLSVVQHNYNFGKVMFHKTSKMSVSASNYYATGKQGTLVINYTLNYIHELPPKMLGGYELLINEMQEGIGDLVYRTRKLAIENGGNLAAKQTGE